MSTYAIRSTLVRVLGVALALASGSALAISYRLTELGTLGGPVSESLAINAAGQVTGGASTGDELHAFLWDGTTMVDLGTLGGPISIGAALNDAGQVTGFAYTLGDIHAFLWDGTTMLDLNALIDPADPLQPLVTLFEGVDFNDLGQILANGFDRRTGDRRAYVLTPIVTVPEPGTLALLSLGLLGLGLTGRKTHKRQAQGRPKILRLLAS